MKHGDLLGVEKWYNGDDEIYDDSCLGTWMNDSVISRGEKCRKEAFSSGV